MGNFYEQVVVRGPAQADLLHFLRDLGRRAYVSPTENGFTVICDAGCASQDMDELASLAMTLSHEFHCAALAVLNHDDAVLWLKLFVEGAAADEYVSNRDFLDADADPAATRGDPKKLCAALGVEGATEAVQSILHRHGVLGYVFEVHRHEALAQALGLPSFSIGLGYNYLNRGESFPGLDPAALLHT